MKRKEVKGVRDVVWVVYDCNQPGSEIDCLVYSGPDRGPRRSEFSIHLVQEDAPNPNRSLVITRSHQKKVSLI
jgi:hypothetical protein